MQTYSSSPERDKDTISRMILETKELARKDSIAELGYKLLFNVEWGWEQVSFQLHLHLLGGW